jgi:holo-[acyl-carrier protein] synthase
MIQGIGTDIIEVRRIGKAISRLGQRFLDRIFSVEEQEYCLRYRDAERHFAGRFAAKEAVVKALGTGFRQGINWLDIEIVNDAMGRPMVFLSEKLQERFESQKLLLSISHSQEYATAFVIYLT